VRPKSETDLQTILIQGMSQELHWFPEDVPLSRLAGVLVGMANSQGGCVLLGIAPRAGQVIGLQNPEAALDRLFQAALLVDPPLVLPIPQRVQVLPHGNEPLRQVLWVTVPTGLPQVYSIDGRYLGREGDQTHPLSARRLRELLIERGGVQFESRTPLEADLEDLDPIQIQAYLDRLGQTGNMSKFLSAEELLFRRGCLRRIDGQLRPSYAALLLFGRYPQQWLPNATILAGRFPGLTLSDVYLKREIGGTLPDQLSDVESFAQSNLKRVVRLVGLTNQETLEYPYEAVRELLVNAVAHRDYTQQGDNIHLFVFADRLEVHSPGELPGPVTLENLLEARFARNAVITQILSDLGFVERLGYGLNRVMESISQAGLPSPQFVETSGDFRVILHNDLGSLSSNQSVRPTTFDMSIFQDLELNPRQKLALNFLARNQRITSHQYQELCPGVHPETLRRDLADLVGQGIMIKVGDKRATYYILKKMPIPIL
jgi:ATP-dependent DNA helicase RecG